MYRDVKLNGNGMDWLIIVITEGIHTHVKKLTTILIGIAKTVFTV
jgi:hypothetical protein